MKKKIDDSDKGMKTCRLWDQQCFLFAMGSHAFIIEGDLRSTSLTYKKMPGVLPIVNNTTPHNCSRRVT